MLGGFLIHIILPGNSWWEFGSSGHFERRMILSVWTVEWVTK
jgi:hypothetical protein